MEHKWVLVGVIIVAAFVQGCDGCLEQERVALLNLKHTFHYDHPMTRTWMEEIDDNASTNLSSVDCCKWEGVECSATTGQVVSLFLEGSLPESYYLVGFNYYDYDYYVSVDASSFLPFQELQILSLIRCHIKNWIDLEGASTKLNNLKFLDLSYNYLDNSVLPYLSGFSSLKFLNLSGNRFMDSVRIQDLPNVEKMESLNLDGLPAGDEFFENIEMMTSLKQLSLSSCGIQGTMLSAKGFKNASTRLEVLDLSGNDISGSISLSGFPSLKSLNLAYNFELVAISLSGFTSLKSLDLTNNRQLSMKASDLPNVKKFESLILGGTSLGDEFLQNIRMMISLKQLSLSDCGGQGKTLSAKDLPVNLETLHLENATLEDRFLENIGRVTSLKELSLYYCKLQGTLGEGICKLKRLQILVIEVSNVRGTLPWCMTNLTSLQHLNVNNNNLWGTLPSSFTNLTSLQYLDLSYNQFKGKISPLEHLTSIQVLSLSNNHFQVPLSLNLFFNHSKLYYLDAQDNEIFIQTEPEPEPRGLAPKFQLKVLKLSGGHGAAFPGFLYYQHDLLDVDISDFKMREGFPNWLLVNNTMLGWLVLVNNSLSGSPQIPNDSHLRLQILDISQNSFSGHIPQEIGSIFPRLRHLDMSANSFDGSIPSSLCDTDRLEHLDLSTNQLSGRIPDRFVAGCSSLDTLILSSNSLQGEIFSSKLNLPNNSVLRVLIASDNQLSGRIPGWIANLTYLQILDLSYNNIYGSLPVGFSPPALNHIILSQNRIQGPLVDAFSNCSTLITLDLSHNQLNGEISDWIFKLYNYLYYLLLNDNQLQGGVSIQFCYFKRLRFIDLSHNNLSGLIFDLSCSNARHQGDYPAWAPNARSPTAWYNIAAGEAVPFTTKGNPYSYLGVILGMMSGINLAYNRLTGEIPPEIGNRQDLHSLNLSHNFLTGPIPSTISNLTEIESLDLSYNSLNGTIPSQLIQLHELEYFTVAHNNLSGQIPNSLQFATFDEKSYEGNPLLCGPPILRSCEATRSSPPSSAPASDHDVDNSNFIDIRDFYITFLASYVCVLLGFLAVLVINPHWRRVWFYFIELCAMTCYYNIMDNLCKLSWSKNM